jgi:hypothetical protein
VPEEATQGIGGPFVTVAAFCERVLEEKDGVNTLVRVIDRYWIEQPLPAALPPGTKAGLTTFYMVIVKSGDFRGQATITVKVRAPSGKYQGKPIVAPLNFTGGEQGNALQIQMGFGLEETGLFWAEVEVDGKLVTRTPLSIELRSTPAPESGPATPSHAV